MTTTIEEWRGRLDQAVEGPLFAHVIRDALTRVALTAESKAKENATARLRTRTGRLRHSIRGEVLDGDAGPEMVLRAGEKTVPYAPIQEEGGEVTPTRSRYLRVPLSAALTPAGVDRFPGPLRQSGAGLFHVRKSAGRLFLFRSDQPGPPWYKLVDRVEIRGKFYLRDAFQEAAEGLPGLVTTEVRRGL